MSQKEASRYTMVFDPAYNAPETEKKKAMAAPAYPMTSEACTFPELASVYLVTVSNVLGYPRK